MRLLMITGTHPSDQMGGAEYQTYLISLGLADAGHTVTFLATATGRVEKFHDRGISVITLRGYEGRSWRRHRREIGEILDELRPEVCYIRRFEEIGFAAAECKIRGIPYVSISCHAMETSPFLLGYSLKHALAYLKTLHSVIHFKSFVAIRGSAIHLCNLKSLEEKTNRWIPWKEMATIYNSSPSPASDFRHAHTRQRVLWVNNLKPWKRPEIFIKLSREFPEYEFVMIGRMAEGRFGRYIRTLLSNAPGNFRYLGAQPIVEVNKWICQSDLLLYTSLPVEGFANSFLQAWLRGTPTVSLTFALDGIPERENIGRCARSYDELIGHVSELMSDHELRNEMGRRAMIYATSQHSVANMISAYEALFINITRAKDNGDTETIVPVEVPHRL